MASVATPWDAEDIRMGTPCKGKSIYMGGEWAVLLDEAFAPAGRVFKINNLYATSMLSYISVNQRKTSQKRSRYSSIRTFLRLLLLINELVLKNGLG